MLDNVITILYLLSYPSSSWDIPLKTKIFNLVVVLAEKSGAITTVIRIYFLETINVCAKFYATPLRNSLYIKMLLLGFYCSCFLVLSKLVSVLVNGNSFFSQLSLV